MSTAQPIPPLDFKRLSDGFLNGHFAVAPHGMFTFNGQRVSPAGAFLSAMLNGIQANNLTSAQFLNDSERNAKQSAALNKLINFLTQIQSIKTEGKTDEDTMHKKIAKDDPYYKNLLDLVEYTALELKVELKYEEGIRLSDISAWISTLQGEQTQVSGLSQSLQLKLQNVNSANQAFLNIGTGILSNIYTTHHTIAQNIR